MFGAGSTWLCPGAAESDVSEEEGLVPKKYIQELRKYIQQLLEMAWKLKEENEALRSYRRRKRGGRSVTSKLSRQPRPLGHDRSMARYWVSQGNSYFRTLWLMALFTSSHQRGRALTQEQAKNLRRALNREWGSQRGEAPPAVPPGWWRGEDLLVLNSLARLNT